MTRRDFDALTKRNNGDRMHGATLREYERTRCKPDSYVSDYIYWRAVELQRARERAEDSRLPLYSIRHYLDRARCLRRAGFTLLDRDPVPTP